MSDEGSRADARAEAGGVRPANGTGEAASAPVGDGASKIWLYSRLAVAGGLLTAGAALAALAVARRQAGASGQGFGSGEIALLALGGVVVLGGLGLATWPGRANASRRCRLWGRATEPAGILLVATWCGLITGWGQVVVFAVRQELLGRIINKGVDWAWMILLANLALFLLLGLVLAGLHNLWPRVVSRFTATFLLAWLAALGLVFMIPRVSPLSLLILAAGIGAVVARVATRHNGGFSTAVRLGVGWPALWRRPGRGKVSRATAAAAPPAEPTDPPCPSRREFIFGASAAIAAVALGTRTDLLVTERRTPARVVKGGPRTPNVLLVVLDTVSAQSMSLYGYSRPTTPNLDRLAKQGTLFAHAVAPSSWTLPSHASMFTGRIPHEYDYMYDRPVVTKHPFLAQVLAGAGYMTAGFSANPYYCTVEFGITRGFAHWEDYRVTPEQAFLYTSFWDPMKDTFDLIERLATNRNLGRKSAEQLNADFLRWATRRPARPFFAFMNFFDAHDPYLPPASFGLRFSDHNPRGFISPEIARDLKEDDLRELRDAYDASICYIDHQVAALIDGLAALDLIDDTVVIVTSDHGEQFGEHGLLSHGNSLYRRLIEVPLLFLWPGQIPAGLVVPTPVNLTDIPATVADLTGSGWGAGLPGQSLAPLWRAATAGPRTPVYSEVDIDWFTLDVPCVKGLYRSLVSSEYHYILQPDGKEELYDLEADPDELRDLSETPAGRDAIAQLRLAFPQG